MKTGDKNSDGLLTYEEFKAAVASSGRIEQQPAAGAPQRSDTAGQQQSSVTPVSLSKADRALMGHLYTYLTENEAVLKDYFLNADKDRSGKRQIKNKGSVSPKFKSVKQKTIG